MIQQIHITKHAVRRFRDRIEPQMTDVQAMMQMVRLLIGAKPKHFKPKIYRKRTSYIPTPDCLFICSRGVIVTVVERR